MRWGLYNVITCIQVASPVEAVALSPVERTAAWVLNNGKYDEMEEEGGTRNMEAGRNPEKVHPHYSQMRSVCVTEQH